MKISVEPADAITFDGIDACLVAPLFEDAKTIQSAALIDNDNATLEASIKKGVVKGKAQECYYLATPNSPYTGIVTMGLGKEDEFDAEALRRAAGKACGLFQSNRISHVVFDASKIDGLPVHAFVEGVVLGQYDFERYKSDDDGDGPTTVDTLTIISDTEDPARRLDRALLGAQNANWARDLGNRGSNDLTPSALAADACAMAKELGCKATVLEEDEMEELGMNALLGVSRGSAEPAKLIILEYHHDAAASTVALVGKGITFDTGGISIKPSSGMHEMKFDMLGAACVLGAFKTIAALKPSVNVICVVPTSENMTGAEAQRPGDIVKAYNGKTIEVHNTDAEGRLVLADALAYLVDKYKPAKIIDAATLTGAIVVGLGHYAAGIFANDEGLIEALQKASDETGERVWAMPMWKDYSKLIEGTHADLCNIGPPGEAGSITAACFLQEFVGDTPWAHLDIAGAAWGGKNISYLNPKHASGYGVRLLTQWVLNEAAS